MICKFLCVPFLIKAQGHVFRYADSLYKTGNYTLAGVEYERVIFEQDAPEIQVIAALRKAECLKMEKEYDRAAATLEEVNTSGISDSLRYKVLFQSAVNSYLACDANSSWSKIELLRHFYTDSSDNRDVLLLGILSLNELQKWKQADSVYHQFMSRYDNSGKAFPDLYKKIPKLKNAEKAEQLSAYLPFTAAGMFYAGNVKEGLLNAGLQVGFIALGVYSALSGYYVTAALIGVGGYAAFYKGGTRRARRLAEKYNDKKVMRFNTEVRNQVLQVALKK